MVTHETKTFFSSNSGLTWQMDALSNSFTNGYDLEIVNGVGWLLCEKVYRNTKPNQITSFNDAMDLELNSFQLYQNYPNPFNPTTNIKYQIPNTTFVTIKVFDILGKEITTLVNEEKVTGIYEIDFDATFLPSGVYFYNLFTESQSISRKMILVR